MHCPIDNSRNIPGWNTYCKELYSNARKNLLDWISDGKIRDGPLFDEMKNSRKLFKDALNFCKRNEIEIRKQMFFESFYEENKTKFWSNARKFDKKNSQFKYN